MVRTSDMPAPADERDRLSGRVRGLANRLAVVRPVGAGGLGAVYEVQHRFTRHRRALKVLHARLRGNTDVVERFLKEASAAGRIKNPHIVETFDAGLLDDGSPYLVMEYLEGRSLRDVLRAHCTLDARLACTLLVQICGAVQAAHDAGIIHRDLKPENLFVCERAGAPFAKVLDFGVSKFVATDGRLVETRSGITLGTPLYAAPEQLMDAKAADARSDVYSLGVVLFELLSGDVPFTAGSFAELAAKVLAGGAPPLTAKVPSALRAAVARSLERDPARRFQTARELAQALAPFVSTRGHDAADVIGDTLADTHVPRPALRPLPRTRWLAAAAAAIALLAGTGAAVWGARQPALRSSSPQPRAARTVEPQALAHYQRGRHFWNKRTADGLTRAAAAFQQALDLDPGYALAWVGLADTYALTEQYAGVPSEENCPRAKAAIARALELDPSLASAHATRGLLLGHCDWSWGEAERELLAAIALDPGYASAHHWYALHLTYRGQFDRGLEEARTAHRLDPLSVIAQNSAALVAGSARRWDDALAQSERLIALEPDFAMAYKWKGRALRARGSFAEARAAFEKAFELSGGKAFELMGELGATAALANDAPGARAWAARIEQTLPQNPAGALHLAMISASLGDTEAAIGWLEKAFEAHSWFLVLLRTESLFDPLRADPRFVAMERRVFAP